MSSAWDTLEAKIVASLEEIKAADPELDTFAADLGNVHRFLPEHEHSSLLPAYYRATVDGAQTVRAWSVFTRQALDFDTIQTTSIRMETTFTAWYSKGVGGAGVNLLRAHVSIVQGKLRSLGVSLGGTVSIIEGWGLVSYAAASNPVDASEGDVIVGEWTITTLRGMAAI